MKKYIIVCAGGFGREIFHTLSLSFTKGTEKGTILGFLDDDPYALGDLVSRYPQILGSIDDYMPQADELVFIATGMTSVKRKLSGILRKKHCSFATIIHLNAGISENVSIGEGSFLGWNVGVSCDVTIGNFVSLNGNLTVGHDTVIEDYAELGPGCAISGFAHIEEGVHLGSGCVVAPGVRIGAWSKVSANCAVLRDVPPFSYVTSKPCDVVRDFFVHPDVDQ